MVRLRNLKDRMSQSTLFRIWEGTCPLEFDSQFECKIVTELRGCICWSSKKEKVNWFTADAFCDYHGMHLISFPFGNLDEDQTVKTLMTAGIWTSANDFITRRVWIFRNGSILSREKAFKRSLRSLQIIGLDELTLSGLPPLNENTTSSWTQPTTCISSSLNNNTLTFYPESCLEKKQFICQQFINIS
ncbi:hypothetical protein DAPPUDRAFT_330677 [Daphnia pulex]|uniref:C-type lectin domain-containing protein n=1 Tax=Daphnia pulex TaxID=6669 RepID=E9HKB5_DAPPU|nr:hypothetical protein DAPPUDRAFT_330677 [Daphnia pulex]|eukprot:EFX67862.1 hypothetical protein DAPPUDRAFT_330677 [Daphnia pulex]